jgi:hypothetical protein
VFGNAVLFKEIQRSPGHVDEQVRAMIWRTIVIYAYMCDVWAINSNFSFKFFDDHKIG